MRLLLRFIFTVLIFAGQQVNAQLDYLQENKPGNSPKKFVPDIFGTIQYEHSSPSFSPDGKKIFWSIRLNNQIGHEIIKFIVEKNGIWSEPMIASFSDSTKGDLYPTFSFDGKRIYFTSDRPINKNTKEVTRNLWYVTIKGNKWKNPKPIIFDSLDVYGFSFAENGNLYFMAQNRSDKSGSYDLYFSSFIKNKYTQPQKLTIPISTEKYEDCPFIARDESYLIFESDRPGGYGGLDFYISFKKGEMTWSTPVNLGPNINSEKSERFAYLSPDGKYLFFACNRDGNFDIYWVESSAIDFEKLKIESLREN